MSVEDARKLYEEANKTIIGKLDKEIDFCRKRRADWSTDKSEKQYYNGMVEGIQYAISLIKEAERDVSKYTTNSGN